MKTTLPPESESHAKYIEGLKVGMIKYFGKKIAKIILYGSFARGDWVYDDYLEDGINYVYASDYDFLVITKHHKHGVHGAGHVLEREIKEKIEKYGHPTKPHFASVIVESAKFINQELEKGKYFFTDIKKEGILLYDSGDAKLAEARDLDNAEIKEISEEYFEHWFRKGCKFLKHCKIALEDSDNSESAFFLHQATESFFHCTLLTLTGYKPKTHKIKDLNQRCASQSNDFLKIFPTANEFQRESLDLLQRAYIESRYNLDYKIEKDQLEYLIERVELLKGTTEKVCRDRVESLN